MLGSSSPGVLVCYFSWWAQTVCLGRSRLHERMYECRGLHLEVHLESIYPIVLLDGLDQVEGKKPDSSMHNSMHFQFNYQRFKRLQSQASINASSLDANHLRQADVLKRQELQVWGGKLSARPHSATCARNFSPIVCTFRSGDSRQLHQPTSD